MSLPEAVSLATRLLMTAAEFDSATGGVQPDRRLWATVKLLSNEGHRDISIEEQERCWKEAVVA
jgi:hypothetical protein